MYFAGIQEMGHVLQKTLMNNLRVHEGKCDRALLATSHDENPLQIICPFRLPIVLRHLDREMLVTNYVPRSPIGKSTRYRMVARIKSIYICVRLNLMLQYSSLDAVFFDSNKINRNSS